MPPESHSRVRIGLGAALGAALAAGAATAQEAELRLRPSSPAAEVRSTGAAPERDRNALLDLRTSASAARPARPPELRRSRAPTSAVVRPPLRRGVAVQTATDVQPPVVGLPDPAVPLPVPPRRRPVEEDPYAPLGLRLGGLTVLPAIEGSAGYDTNPNRVARGAEGSMVYRTEGEVRLRSDWSRHALTGTLRGAYNAYADAEGANRPEGEGNVALRLDLLRDTQVELEGRFRLDTERPGSPELGVSVSERPIVATFGGAVGVTQRFNRFALGLRGSVERTDFEDARLASGTVLDQSDRNVTETAVRLRGSYELTPGLIPFVEASLDARVHDRTVDDAGFRRDSTGVTGRVGSTFEITRTLTGEAAAGYQARDYEDPRLKELRGPVGEAALVWSATPLTTVRLRAAATLAETSLPEASGAVASRATLEVQHDLRRNLSLTASATLAQTDYRGIRLREETQAGTLRVDYKLTRSVALRASFTHERLTSTSPGSDYTANVYLVGLRFQP